MGESVLRGGGLRDHIDAAALHIEQNFSVGERVKRPIAAHTHVLAGDKLAAALANDDAAGADDRAAKFFNAVSFADAVASVFYAALTFFMCHTKSLELRVESWAKKLRVDGGDFHDGEFLAMADGLVITFTAFHLERHFFLAAFVRDDIGDNIRAADGGRSHGDFAFVVDHEHAVKRDGFARLGFETFDFELVAGNDTVLFATSF